MTDFFRCSFGIVSRSDGHSAAKRSAYQSCGRLSGIDGCIHDFRRKAPEHVGGLVLLPDGAPAWCGDVAVLWQRAAAAERRVDAQEARILDFSMPRTVPAELRLACARHVYEPFRAAGMVVQIDLHDTEATDGGRNVHVHGLATLRRLSSDGFGPKCRDWNTWMTRRGGRDVRELIALRLKEFATSYGIPYDGDARANAVRDRPKPEPTLPKWNFESRRRGQPTEAMIALQAHRVRRRAWEAAHQREREAEAELKRLTADWDEEQTRRRRRRAITPSRMLHADARARRLRNWHRSGWIPPETVTDVRSIRHDEARDCLWIDMNDGSVIVETRDEIELLGKVTAAGVRQMVASAQLAGWKEVAVTGHQAFRDAVTSH